MDAAWQPERLGTLIKEWQQNWGVAVDCLESLRPIIGLQPTSAVADATARKAATALFQQVPSTALLDLAQSQPAAAAPSIDLPSMQAEYIVLQEAARALEDGLTSMTACYQEGITAMQHETDELAYQYLQLQSGSTQGLHHDQQFTSLEQGALSCQEPDVGALDSTTQQSLQLVAAPDMANGSDVVDTVTTIAQQLRRQSQSEDMPHDISTPPQDSAAMEPVVTVLEPGELLVLLGDLCAAYERQLQMLALICGSLNLSTPQPVLETYITFMKLQPFTDERVAQALQLQLAQQV